MDNQVAVAALSAVATIIVAIIANVVLARGKRADARSTELNTILGESREMRNEVREELSKAKAELYRVREEHAGLAVSVKELQGRREEDHARIKSLEASLTATRGELQETRDTLNDSIELNLAFIEWVNSGSPPPPPSVESPRLRVKLKLDD